MLFAHWLRSIYSHFTSQIECEVESGNTLLPSPDYISTISLICKWKAIIRSWPPTVDLCILLWKAHSFAGSLAACKWNWSQYSNMRLNVNFWGEIYCRDLWNVSRSGLRGVMRSYNLFMSSVNKWKMRNLCNIVDGNWFIKCAWSFYRCFQKGLFFQINKKWNKK